MNNPLIPPSDDDQPDKLNRAGYVLPRGNYSIAPPTRDPANPAANVIRQKLDKIYAAEPDAAQEEQEAVAAPVHSKHQQFMLELNGSDKDLAQIQTEWHNYYVNLPDDEKRQVWQEFYASNANAHKSEPQSSLPPGLSDTERLAIIKNQVSKKTDRRTPKAIRKTVRQHVTAGGKIGAKQHLQSLLFGVGLGLVVVIIFLFGFFNQIIIAPFIQPSRKADATPIIVSSSSITPTSTPEVIIPKINVEIPVDFSETSTNEATIENDLQSGVVHYPTTSLPGQTGNAAFFGHSSNNIFNQGKYKFAFVLLHELVPGDTFYITNAGKVYVYKVFSKTIVDPSDVSVLDPVAGHTATATLITCDPPGTSLHRLVVVGDQISPDPSGNSAAAEATTTASAGATQLAGDGQTLWGHFISKSYNKAGLVVVGTGAVIVIFRRGSRSRA